MGRFTIVEANAGLRFGFHGFIRSRRGSTPSLAIDDMTKRRLIIDGMIVAAAIGLLVTHYLVPERIGAWRGGYYSLAQCTQFAVVRDSVVPGGDGRPAGSHWTASITISNVGPRRAELLPAEIVSRFRTGSESWPVPMPGLVLRPGGTTSITVQLPVTGRDPGGPRVWELRGQYQTRESKAAQWLVALHDRLHMQLDRVIYRPGVYRDSLLGRYPENYDSMLTNELGWRFKIVGLGLDGRGLHREWRPGAEVEDGSPPWHERALHLAKQVGKPIIVTARTPTVPVANGSELPPRMITTEGELTFYRGQLDEITDTGIRVRATFTNLSDSLRTVELRGADILSVRFVRRDAEQEQREVISRILGEQNSAQTGASHFPQSETRSPTAAGARR